MDKRQLHHIWTKFRAVKPWYFLVLTLVLGIVCVFALRANNQHMVELRNDVYAADKNDGDVKTALNNLRQYVYGHMNTNLSSGPDAVYPPIQLKYTYERLVASQNADAHKTNAQVYTEAQHYCERQDSVDFSGHNRVPCIEAYVSSHGANAAPIPDALYKFDFISPTWSPDLAGWSLLAAILSGLLFVVSFVLNRWVKR